jgi:hypothetical protein
MKTPSHYDLNIQPVDYIIANDIPFCEGNVIKYISRWKNKNGLDDLKKARHYIDMLIVEAERQQSLAIENEQETYYNGNTPSDS